jgi:hypothetical protein
MLDAETFKGISSRLPELGGAVLEATQKPIEVATGMPITALVQLYNAPGTATAAAAAAAAASGTANGRGAGAAASGAYGGYYGSAAQGRAQTMSGGGELRQSKSALLSTRESLDYGSTSRCGGENSSQSRTSVDLPPSATPSFALPGGGAEQPQQQQQQQRSAPFGSAPPARGLNGEPGTVAGMGARGCVAADGGAHAVQKVAAPGSGCLERWGFVQLSSHPCGPAVKRNIAQACTHQAQRHQQQAAAAFWLLGGRQPCRRMLQQQQQQQQLVSSWRSRAPSLPHHQQQAEAAA